MEVFRLTESDVLSMISSGISFLNNESDYVLYRHHMESKLVRFSEIRKAIIYGKSYKFFDDAEIFSETFDISLNSVLYDMDKLVTNEAVQNSNDLTDYLKSFNIDQRVFSYIRSTFNLSNKDIESMLHDYYMSPSNYIPEYRKKDYLSFDKNDINPFGEKYRYGITSDEVEKLLILEKESNFSYPEIEKLYFRCKDIEEISSLVKRYTDIINDKIDDTTKLEIKNSIMMGKTVEEAILSQSEFKENKLYRSMGMSSRMLESSGDDGIAVDRYINTGYVMNENDNVEINPVTGDMEFKLLVDDLMMLDGTSFPIYLRYQNARAIIGEPRYNNQGNVVYKYTDEMRRFSFGSGWSLQTSYFNVGNKYYNYYSGEQAYLNIEDIDAFHLRDGRTVSVKINPQDRTLYTISGIGVKDVIFEVCNTVEERNELTNDQCFKAPGFSTGVWDSRPALKVIYKDGTKEYFNYFGYLLGVLNKNNNGYIVRYDASDYPYIRPIGIESTTGQDISIQQNNSLVTLKTENKRFLLEKVDVGYEQIPQIGSIRVQKKFDSDKEDIYRFNYTEGSCSFKYAKRMNDKRIYDTRMSTIVYPTGLKADFTYGMKYYPLGDRGYIEKPAVTSYKLSNGSKRIVDRSYYFDSEDQFNVKTYDLNGVRTEYVLAYDGKYAYIPDYINKYENATNKWIYNEYRKFTSDFLIEKRHVTSFNDNNRARAEVDFYTYDGKGNVLTHTLPNGHIKKYEYDKKYSMLTKYEIVTNPGTIDQRNVLKEAYTLDERGNYSTKKEYSDYNNYVLTTYKYDQGLEGNLKLGFLTNVKVENGDNDYEKSYEYDYSYAKGFINHDVLTDFFIVLLDGKVKKELYKTNKFTVKESRTKYSIDKATKLVTGIVDANNNQTQYKYDYKGRITKIIYADGSEQNIEYDDPNRNYIVSMPSGSKTKYEYDRVGNLVAQYVYDKGIYKNILRKTYTYDNLLSSSTDANGNTTTYGYDLFNRPTKTTFSDGTSTEIKYDGYLHQETLIDQEGNSVTSTYNDFDQIVEEKCKVDADEYKTTYTYDHLGNLSSKKMANGSVYNYKHNWIGQLIEVKSPNNLVSTYDYDKLGNLVKVEHVDSEQNRTYTKNYVRNQLGQVLEFRDERGKITQKTYDLNGNLIQRIDPNGDNEKFTYNNRNLLVESNYPSYKKTYSYNVMGDIERVDVFQNKESQTPSQTYNYSYDSLNRLKKRIEDDGKFIEYDYDYNGNIVKIKDYFGGVTTYDYNSSNLISSVNRGNRTFNYTYYPDGMIKTLDYPVAGYKTKYTYDTRNFLKTLNNETYGSSAHLNKYSYDSIGNINKIFVNNQLKVSADYDDEGQIKKLITPSNSIDYGYDAKGNLTHQQGTLPINISFNAGTYEWDNEDRLSKFTSNTNHVTTYSYDERGLRRNKNNLLENVDYYYDANRQLINEKKDGQSISIVNGHLPLMRIIDGKEYYYLYNGHNDVISLIDANGTKVNEYTYDVWGKITNARENVYNDLKYASEIYDKETGNYYLRARYYSPETHRFISVDTYEGELKNPLTMNQNIYCLNNPLVYVDPHGEFPVAVLYVYFTAVVSSPDIQMDMQFIADDLACGDYVSAGLDVIGAAVPGATGVGKATKKVAGEVADGFKKAFKFDLQQFAKGTVKPNQVHHFLTNKSKTYTKQIEKITKKYGLDLNGAWNKAPMPHQGRHANAYHDYMLEQINQIDNIAQGDKDLFIELFDQVKENVIDNPDMLYKEFWR